MRHFMGEGCVIAFGIAECLERRHLHMVAASGIKGHVAAVPNSSARCGKE